MSQPLPVAWLVMGVAGKEPSVRTWPVAVYADHEAAVLHAEHANRLVAGRFDEESFDNYLDLLRPVPEGTRYLVAATIACRHPDEYQDAVAESYNMREALQPISRESPPPAYTRSCELAELIASFRSPGRVFARAMDEE